MSASTRQHTHTLVTRLLALHRKFLLCPSRERKSKIERGVGERKILVFFVFQWFNWEHKEKRKEILFLF
ncbi:hypothetical protein VNO77_29230 [Canavalia gladiata]|uniref:Uncharacterized protein n=1 Tax=Canavalia gladiata TaxID=3824 RepID=A0AAN9Q7K8_CANGL